MPKLHIYLDLETIPTQRPEVQEKIIGGIGPPSNYKSEEAITKWWKEKGETEKHEAIGKTALSGTFGEIIAIGFAVNDGPVAVCRRQNDIPAGMSSVTPEIQLLSGFNERLWQALKDIDQDDPEGDVMPYQNSLWATWVGHNIEDFDMRFLWQRSKVNDVKFRFPLPTGRYPKGPYIYDTMKEWGGWQGRVSQRDLELAFQLERKDPLAAGGAEVWERWQAGDIDGIVQHCEEDVRLLREIHRRMTA